MPRKSAFFADKSSFSPPNDQATHRDLLLFEERLKTNALLLNRRKSRYQFLLLQLIVGILFLLCEVLLQTSFLSIPYRYLLHRALPDVYGPDTDARLHPYVASGLLFVAVTTLLLFFASGLYSEKIGYANRYVPHANRALRNFNMYLNLRKAPGTSPFNPLSYLFPRPTSPRSASPTSSPPRTPSPTRLGKRSSSAVPIPSIPPTTNPRGELIFSSRVDRAFRDSYERYRAAFERKRDERERALAARTWSGWLAQRMPWNRSAVQLPSSPGTGTVTPSATRGGTLSLRGRGGGTPGSSRRSSPAPHLSGADRGRAGSSPGVEMQTLQPGVGYM
ncbi:hypothetical protein FA95DRAFT_1487066 [Auriscalpium vulgare]|uniref:Uncharacterized protein n=1 Tax=Auriscalpium vulgare TaxID=40419 RepID=A0ACB8S327_9AGAM|nr:hypothetical protein FA95DRAFT_1487066 [Auriscalpium vulgare]